MIGFRKELKILLPLIRGEVKFMLPGTLLGIMAVVAAVGLFSLSGWFLSATAAAGLVFATAKSFNFFLPSIGVRILAVTRTLARYGERLFCHDATFRILERLRTWCYRCLEPLSPNQLKGFGTGDILSRIVGDVDALDNLYLRVFSPVLIFCVAMLILISGLLYIDPVLALIAGTFLTTAGWGVPIWALKLGHATGRTLVGLQSRLRGNLVQGLQGMAELLVFDLKSQYVSEIEATHEHLILQQRQMAHYNGYTNALLILLSGAATMATLLFGVEMVARGEMTGEILTLVTLAVMGAFEAVGPLPAAFQYLNHTRSSAQRLIQVAETPPLVTFPAQTILAPSGIDLSFNQINFRYGPTDSWVLKDFSLTVPAGSHIAVVGPSGVGKTTLAHLMMRFIEPEDGEILVGGVPLSHFSETDLRRQVTLLSQNAHIFNGTIRSNLLLADPDANEDELQQALSAACLDRFVASLPDALDTWVGEGGKQLSGGQMQRLALARVFLHPARILILDEPTEGLDPTTESILMDRLLALTDTRTLIVISHRSSVIERFNRSVSLNRSGFTLN